MLVLVSVLISVVFVAQQAMDSESPPVGFDGGTGTGTGTGSSGGGDETAMSGYDAGYERATRPIDISAVRLSQLQALKPYHFGLSGDVAPKLSAGSTANEQRAFIDQLRDRYGMMHRSGSCVRLNQFGLLYDDRVVPACVQSCIGVWNGAVSSRHRLVSTCFGSFAPAKRTENQSKTKIG